VANSIPATQLADHIQTLLAQRKDHVDAIAAIDETLAGVGAALTGTVAPKARAAAVKVVAKAPAVGKRRRGRGNFALSAEESILAFVKANKNPTTQEINQHFKGEGRSSTADNALSKMTRENRLKRTPLGKGIRGSRYTVA